MQEFVHATAIRHKAFSLSSTMGIPWNAFRNYLNLRKLAFNATGEKLWNRYSRAERRQDHPRTCFIPSEFRWTRRISLVTVSVRKTQWRKILLLISLTWCRGTLPVKVTTTKKKKKRTCYERHCVHRLVSASLPWQTTDLIDERGSP